MGPEGSRKGGLRGIPGLWGRVPLGFPPRRNVPEPLPPFPISPSGSPWGGGEIGNGRSRPRRGSPQAGGTTVAHAGRILGEFTSRLAGAGIDPSVGSAGDAYDNALAESQIGLFKTELFHPHGPWRDRDHLEPAILDWVTWFNTERPHESVDDFTRSPPSTCIIVTGPASTRLADTKSSLQNHRGGSLAH